MAGAMTARAEPAESSTVSVTPRLDFSAHDPAQ
jgi:hypothetical protein